MLPMRGTLVLLRRQAQLQAGHRLLPVYAHVSLLRFSPLRLLESNTPEKTPHVHDNATLRIKIMLESTSEIHNLSTEIGRIHSGVLVTSSLFGFAVARVGESLAPNPHKSCDVTPCNALPQSVGKGTSTRTGGSNNASKHVINNLRQTCGGRRADLVVLLKPRS